MRLVQLALGVAVAAGGLFGLVTEGHGLVFYMAVAVGLFCVLNAIGWRP